MRGERLIRRSVQLGTILLAIAFYLGWEIGHRAVYAYDTSIYAVDPADEWRYTACSRLVAHGYALFSQVYSAQPPLLFASLAGGMRLFGDNIDGARWVEIFFGFVTLLAVAWIAYRLAGGVAAMAGAVLLALSPGFLVYAHTIEAEGPMMALSTLSLALLLQYVARSERGSTPWPTPTTALLAAAGLSLAAAILMKLFAVETLLPAVALLLLRPTLNNRVTGGVSQASLRIREAGLFLACAAVPVILEFALVSPAQQWQQVIELHNKAASANLGNVTPAISILGNFLSLDLGLSVLAAFGLLVAGYRAIRARQTVPEAGSVSGSFQRAVFLALWLPGSIVMLLFFKPLFPHHAAILMAPLAVAAGVGVASLVRLLQPWACRERTRSSQAGSVRASLITSQTRAVGAFALTGIAAVVFYAALVPRLAHDDRHFLVATAGAASDPLVVYVAQHTSAGEFIAADDLRIADAAKRSVPPPLCDPSNVRLRSGYLTAHDLIEATRAYHVRIVVPSFGIYRQVGAYIRWLQQHYVEQKAPDGVTVYVPRHA